MKLPSVCPLLKNYINFTKGKSLNFNDVVFEYYKMVLVFIETHCQIKFSRSILPWMQEVSNNPKLLKHIFGCKEKEFKRLYGEFALNKTKSEAIIGQHNEYFNVRI